MREKIIYICEWTKNNIHNNNFYWPYSLFGLRKVTRISTIQWKNSKFVRNEIYHPSHTSEWMKSEKKKKSVCSIIGLFNGLFTGHWLLTTNPLSCLLINSWWNSYIRNELTVSVCLVYSLVHRPGILCRPVISVMLHRDRPVPNNRWCECQRCPVEWLECSMWLAGRLQPNRCRRCRPTPTRPVSVV